MIPTAKQARAARDYLIGYLTDARAGDELRTLDAYIDAAAYRIAELEHELGRLRETVGERAKRATLDSENSDPDPA